MDLGSRNVVGFTPFVAGGRDTEWILVTLATMKLISALVDVTTEKRPVLVKALLFSPTPPSQPTVSNFLLILLTGVYLLCSVLKQSKRNILHL